MITMSVLSATMLVDRTISRLRQVNPFVSVGLVSHRLSALSTARKWNNSAKRNISSFSHWKRETVIKMVSLPARNARGAVYFTSLDSSLQKETEMSGSKGGAWAWRLYARQFATFCDEKNSIRPAGIKPYETCRSDRVMCRWKISMVKSAVPFTLIQRIMRERNVSCGRMFPRGKTVSTNYHQWRSAHCSECHLQRCNVQETCNGASLMRHRFARCFRTRGKHF